MIDGDDDGPWTVRTLKAYFERIICDIGRRITNMEKLGASFYSRDQHDAFAANVTRQFDQLRIDIDSSRRPQWALWIAGVTLLMSVTAGIWYLAVQPIKSDLEHLSLKDGTIDDAIKATNTRIDRLYDLYRDLNNAHMELMHQQQQKSPR